MVPVVENGVWLTKVFTNWYDFVAKGVGPDVTSRPRPLDY